MMVAMSASHVQARSINPASSDSCTCGNYTIIDAFVRVRCPHLRPIEAFGGWEVAVNKARGFQHVVYVLSMRGHMTFRNSLQRLLDHGVYLRTEYWNSCPGYRPELTLLRVQVHLISLLNT
jgi:hypothetical protein